MIIVSDAAIQIQKWSIKFSSIRLTQPYRRVERFKRESVFLKKFFFCCCLFLCPSRRGSLEIVYEQMSNEIQSVIKVFYQSNYNKIQKQNKTKNKNKK